MEQFTTTMKTRAALLFASLACMLVSQAQDWVPLTSGVSDDLLDVFFISPSQGWVVGENGVILSTVNGGDTWTPQVSPNSNTLYSVEFISPTKGWASGVSTLLTTENGGATWSAVPITPVVTYYDIVFTSPDTGYVVGGSGITGVVIRTTNGGLSWSSTTVDRVLNAVSFTSNTSGWACGSRGVIYHTTDGVAWTQQVAPGANQTSNLITIHMISDLEGWAGGHPSSNKYTVDGGVTWTNRASGTNAGKTDLHFFDPQNGWMSTTTPLGNAECPAGCPLSSTTDGGANWVGDTLRGPTIQNMMFYDVTLGWAVCIDGWILRYGEGGGTAVTEVATQNAIRISPNPVSDRLILTSGARILTAEVFNAVGARVLTATGSVTGLDVGTLPPGSYTIRMTTEGDRAQQVGHFIKE